MESPNFHLLIGTGIQNKQQANKQTNLKKRNTRELSTRNLPQFK